MSFSITQVLIDGYQKMVQVNNGDLVYDLDWNLLPVETEGVLASFQWNNNLGTKYLVNNLTDNIPLEPVTLYNYGIYQPIIDSYFEKITVRIENNKQAEEDMTAEIKRTSMYYLD